MSLPEMPIWFLLPPIVAVALGLVVLLLVLYELWRGWRDDGRK